MLELREELATAGLDAGPDTIAWHLVTHHQITVSRSTNSRHRQDGTRPLASRRPGRRADHRPLPSCRPRHHRRPRRRPTRPDRRQTRHRDLSVLVNRYIRPLEALATISSRDLGL